MAIGILLQAASSAWCASEGWPVHYLGLGYAADALNTAFRIPGFLQNLLGEGALSASFIPRYAKLLSDGNEEEARKTTASALLSVMIVTLTILVLKGESSARHG